MAHATLMKFNYPRSLLREYESWVVLLRPEQVTVGSLIVACKLDVTRFSDVPASSFAELAEVTSDLEGVLQPLFTYDKINYLGLMMVDSHVHFHVLPRYATRRDVAGVLFIDASWPRPPDLSNIADITADQYAQILTMLKDRWPHRHASSSGAPAQ